MNDQNTNIYKIEKPNTWSKTEDSKLFLTKIPLMSCAVPSHRIKTVSSCFKS